jgi:hypothetical protein
MVLDHSVWLAAALAPKAVGPHPNFSRPVVSPPGALAVIANRIPHPRR